MQLDMPTLMVTGSFVAACTGVVLLFAWTDNRNTPALAIWGFGNIFIAAGIYFLVFGLVSRQPLYFTFADNLLVLGPGLIWKAARSFDRKPAPFRLALLGFAVTAIAGVVPGIENIASALGLAFGALYLFAAAATLWPSRQEPLPARRPIIIFTVTHATVLLFGARHALNGEMAQDQVPPLMSLFGLVHFESIVFLVATAVFILALVKERSEAVSRLAAHIDSLTGIANRAAFMESADRIVERCRRNNAPVAVIMFDLDDFKSINDTHGHAVGDIVLRKFSEVTRAALRPGDVLGRLGGEEFAAVLPRSDIEPAYGRADRIRATFAEDCRDLDGRQIKATVSGGVAVSANANMTLSELLARADQALYRAKAAGRNHIKRADKAAPEGGFSAVVRAA